MIMKKTILMFIFILLCSFAYAGVLPTDEDLLVFWKFDEAANGLYDSKDNSFVNLNLLLTDGVLFQRTPIPSYSEYSVGFDGNNDYLVNSSAQGKINTQALLNGIGVNFSISLWVTFDDDEPEDDEHLIFAQDFSGSNQHGFRIWKEEDGANGYLVLQNVDQDGNGGGCDSASTTIVFEDKDYDGAKGIHLVFTGNGSHVGLWENGSLKEIEVFTDELCDFDAGNGLIIGAKYFTSLGDELDGSLDDYAIFNRTLTPDEIIDIYTTGIAEEEGDNIDILFVDYNNISYGNSLNETDLFYPVINLTNAGEVIDSAECLINITNVTAVFNKISAVNITLSDTGDILNLTLTESQTDGEDIYKFEVCSGAFPGMLQVIINGDIIQNLSEDIPRCSLGTHIEESNISDYIGVAGINFTLKCVDCNNPNEFFTILSDSVDSIMSYERTSGSYIEDLTFKSDKYIYNNHFLKINSNSTAFGYCNDTTASENFIFGDIPLTIKILSINNITFESGMTVEIKANNSVLIDISGDIVSGKTLNITFNGTVINGTCACADETFKFSSLQDLGDGIYNISIYARDNDGSETYLRDYFIINDTTQGSIAWYYPLENNQSGTIVNTTIALDISFFDENLFSRECIVRNPLGNIAYNFSVYDIQATTNNLNANITTNMTGNYTVTCRITDSHTTVLIDDIKYKIKDKSINYSVLKIDGYSAMYLPVNIEYTGLYELEAIKTGKSVDRYTWEYDFYLGDDKFLESVSHSWRLTCSNSYYITQTVEFPHFICFDAFQWVDFNSKDLQVFNVFSCGVGCWDIITEMKPNNKVKFSSIGFQNEFIEAAVIEVSSGTTSTARPEYLQLGECPIDSLPETVIFIFIITLGLAGSIYLKIYIKIPIVSLMYNLSVGIASGFALVSCSPLLGGVLIVVFLMMAFSELFN